MDPLDFLLTLLAATVVLLIVGGVLARWLNDIVVYIIKQWIGVEVERATAQKAWAEAHEATENVMLVSAKNGNLPVSRKLLESGHIIDAQLTLMAQDIDTRKPVQNVPHTLHYAPHYARITEAVDGNTTQTPDEPNMEIADFWSLYNSGKLPSNGFLMGYNMDNGEPVVANWLQLYSALVGGASGSGKSTMIRNILAQSAIQGGRFVVLDKHFGSGGESLGESLMPLRSHLVGDVAASEAQMLDALKYVYTVGEQRKSGQDKDRTPLILIVDETTALLQRSNIAQELTKVLGEIAQETRKVSVYAMCIGQNFHGKIMDTTVRNSFVSMITCRTRRDVARTMSGNNDFAVMAEQLRRGQAVWMNPDGDMVRIAVPNTTQAHIEALAHEIDGQVVEPLSKPLPASLTHTPNDNAGSDDEEDAVETPVESAVVMDDESPVVDATLVMDGRRMDMVKRLFLSGTARNDILLQVWGVDMRRGGRGVAKAARELDDILRCLIQKG